MLVVIGPQWVNITDSKGNKRLFEEDDATRIEVETGLLGKDILVIPVLVMNAGMPSAEELPPSLCELHYRNAVSIRPDPDFDNDIEKLIAGIQGSPNWMSKPLKLEPFEPETIPISKGLFRMGSDESEGIPSYETPAHDVDLPAFRIGKSPVTNKQYWEFARKSKTLVDSRGLGWRGQNYVAGTDNQPVTGVTWLEVLAYCTWLRNATGRDYSIPNEAQWEKACRLHLANDATWGKLPEWTCTLWGGNGIRPDSRFLYPWQDDDRNDLDAHRNILRVVRGDFGVQDNTHPVRLSLRYGLNTEDRSLGAARLTFRVVLLLL
jgi:formylglycine-generating enzyme required for sulfatase activity